MLHNEIDQIRHAHGHRYHCLSFIHLVKWITLYRKHIWWWRQFEHFNKRRGFETWLTGNWGQGGPLSPFQRLHPLRARDSAKSSMCQERIPFPKSRAQTSLSLALSLLFPTVPKYLASSRSVVPTKFPVTTVSLTVCVCASVCMSVRLRSARLIQTALLCSTGSCQASLSHTNTHISVKHIVGLFSW